MSEKKYPDYEDWKRLMKRMAVLEEFILNQSVPKAALKNKWVSGPAAMELLAVKETKFKSLRNNGEIVWRYKHGNRGVEVLLKSIEDYKNNTSTRTRLLQAV